MWLVRGATTRWPQIAQNAAQEERSWVGATIDTIRRRHEHAHALRTSKGARPVLAARRRGVAPVGRALVRSGRGGATVVWNEHGQFERGEAFEDYVVKVFEDD